MNETIYSAPKSNPESTNDMRGSPKKAILIATLVSNIGAILMAMIIGFVLATYWASTGVSTDEISMRFNSHPLLLVFYLLQALVFSVWAGHYIAKKTNHKEYIYCGIMVLIGYGISLIMYLVTPSTYEDLPLWYNLAGFILYGPTIFLGCWLNLRAKT